MESADRPGALWLHRRTDPILTGQLEPLLARIPDEMKRKEDMEAALRKELSGLPDVPLRFHTTVKHVFSHRVHFLSVFSGSVEEAKLPSHRDFAWWTVPEIRDAGTTSWLLLVPDPRSPHLQMLKTAHYSVQQLKKLPKCSVF